MPDCLVITFGTPRTVCLSAPCQGSSVAITPVITLPASQWSLTMRGLLYYTVYRANDDDAIYTYCKTSVLLIRNRYIERNSADPEASVADDFFLAGNGVGVGRRRDARRAPVFLSRFDLRRFLLPLTLERCGSSAPHRCIHSTVTSTFN